MVAHARSPRLRSATDPRVVEVVTAFERQLGNAGAFDVDGFMTCVLDLGVVDRFITPEPWPAAAIRNVLLAFLLNAPDEDLDEMVEKARGEQAMMDAIERGEDFQPEAVSP